MATDNAIGTAGEFGMGSPLGFDEVGAGGTFYKIGVGRLVRPDDEAYFFAKNYSVDSIPWTVRRGPNWIEFIQRLPEENGWGYRYSKRVELDAERPVLLIRYALENTGAKQIKTDYYCHNFVVIDGRAPGPGTWMRLDFIPEDQSRLKKFAMIEHERIEFVAPLPPGESLHRKFVGFAVGEGRSATIESDGVGLRVATGATPNQVVFYALGSAISFEPLIEIDLSPGETKTWTDRYEPASSTGK